MATPRYKVGDQFVIKNDEEPTHVYNITLHTKPYTVTRAGTGVVGDEIDFINDGGASQVISPVQTIPYINEKETDEMATAKIKVGDKILLTEKLDKDRSFTTEGKEYEVIRLEKPSDPVVIDDRGTERFMRRTEWFTKVPTKRKPAVKKAKVVLPTTTIASHEVIGQDENKKVVELAIEHNLPVLLIGETGTGKTSIVREQSIKLGKQLTRFSITGETTVDEFVGKYELESGATVWKDGVLLDAMKNGKWLVADEINVALPEILFVLHSLLDDDHFITVSNHLGEVVKPHEDFRFFATMNPPEEYAGTKELNKAFQSRFSVVLQVNYPEPEVEVKILVDKAGIEPDHATKMVDVANALRKAKKEDKIFFTCSTRDLLHWADVVAKGLDPNKAFEVAVLNKTGGDAKVITDIYQAIIGDYIAIDTPEVTLTIDWFKQRKVELDKDFADFEARKTEIREEITADIVKQLTSPKAIAAGQSEEITDGIFS